MLPLWLWLLAGTPADPLAAGDQAFRAGDYAGALNAWGPVLQDARIGKKSDLQFEVLLRMAAVHRRLGKVETAAKAIEAASNLATTPEQQAHLKLDLASNDLARGDLKAAEKGYAAAFKQLRDVKEPVGAASAALNLGSVRRVQGDRDGAIKAFDAAQTLFDALEDRGGLAALGLQRCKVARDAGDLGLAAQRCDRATEYALESQEYGIYIDLQLVRGGMYTALGRTGAALGQYRAALKQAAGRKDVAAQARLYNAIGGLLLARGDAAAREHLELAETAFRESGQERAALQVAVNLAMLQGGRGALAALVPRAEALDDPFLLATLYLNLAALGDTSVLSKARKLIDRSGHTDLLWRLWYLDAQQRLKANPTDDKGLALLRDAVDELERRRLGVAERDQASAKAFLTEHTQVYRDLINAFLARGDNAGAYVYAQKLAATDVVLEQDPVLQRFAISEDYITAQMEASKDAEQQRELAAQLGALRIEFAKAVDEMRGQVQDFDRLVKVDPEDLEAIQAELPPGVTVLQPVLFSDQLVLMVLRRDHLQVVTVPVDGIGVQATIRKLSRSLQGKHISDLEWTQARADELGGWLLKPIAELLEGTEVLVTTTSGDLREVPFAMLRYDGRYAIERFAVAGVTNVASLSRKAPAFRLDGNAVLLVGNPDGTLPGAEDEVGELGRQLPGSQVLVGAQGTREALLDRLRGEQVVHLATHGRIDREHPTDSYLALAGGGEAGRLSYQEIPGLAGYLSSCRLVVLSACQSGVAVQGQDQGDGGIVVSINGLAAQFRRAGVETLVASLWSVDDQGTRRLMTGMYNEMAGGADIAEGLRRSQLSMLGDGELAHPWYWAGFVVVGDWR